jgi:hypothetical protein
MRISRPLVGMLAPLLLILSARSLAQAYEVLAKARTVVASVAPYPDYLQAVTDAAFGTPFARVTDPGRQVLPSIFCKPVYCAHRVAALVARLSWPQSTVVGSSTLQ